MISGFYNILKPTGYTSSDVVVKLRGILGSAYNTKVKIGHFGTLDPGGSGVLVVAIGNATKLFDYFGNHKKTYRAEAVFGVSTDTLDSYGQIVEKSEWYDSANEIDNGFYDKLYRNLSSIVKSFIGKQKQLPPDYSSKSIGGMRAYDLARSGEKVVLKEAEIEIFDVTINSVDKNRVSFDITCSSGTYIRSFVRDLGYALGVPSFMSYIIRLECAGFSIEHSVTVEEVAKNEKAGFVDLSVFADKLPEFVLSDEYKDDFAVGNKIYSEKFSSLSKVVSNGVFIGIADFSQGFLKMVVTDEKNPVFVSSFEKRIHRQKYSIALGYFDTMHLAHNEILKELAKTIGLKSLFTFSEPLNKFLNVKKDGDLYSLEERIGLYEKAGVKHVFVEKPTKDFLDKTPEDFFNFLTDHINIGTIVCGFDFTFGKKASGTVETLRSLCYENQIVLKVVEEQTFEGVKISSSRIKNCIKNGEIELANKLLGRDFSIRGSVLQGRRQGRTIGFPTINLKLDDDLLKPRFGVYKGYAKVFGKKYKAIINVGTHPTFDDFSTNVEAYLLDFSQDIYGYKVEIFLQKYIREIFEFENVQELVTQIKKDLEVFDE